MLSRKIILIGAMLLSISLGVAAADLVLKPGSSAVFVLKPARAAIANTDTTPPTTTAGPTVSSITDTTASLSATIDEYGTGYYLVQFAAAAAPNVSTVLSSGTSFAMTAKVAAIQGITGLIGSTSYKLYFVAKDARNNVQAAVVSVPFTTDLDNTPPITTAGPSVPAKSETAVTLSATINEAGIGYYLVKLATDPAPSVATVKTGTSFAMAANSPASTNITGLTGSTNYIIYFLAKDASGNWQTSTSQVAVTTDADTTPPNTTAGPSVSGITSTSAVFSATINEAGTGYYLVRLDGDPAPDVNTVRSIGNSFTMTANAPATPTITGLSASTSYKIYFVAKDTSSNWQAMAQFAAFSTLVAIPGDTTPPITTMGPSVSSTTSTSTILSATINEAGTGYYLVKLAGDPAPDVNTVRTTGTSFAMAANTAANQTITSLTANTAYKVYFVAKDVSENVQAAAQMVAFTATANPCFTATNTAHVSAGRAIYNFSTFHYLANGSNNDMGTSTFASTKLRQTGTNYFIIDASCP